MAGAKKSKKRMQLAARRKVENKVANKRGKKNVFGNKTYSGSY